MHRCASLRGLPRQGDADVPRQTPRPRHRLDQRHRARHRASPRQGRRRRRHQRLRRQGGDRERARRDREGIRRQGVLQRRRHDQGAGDRGDDRRRPEARSGRSTFWSTTPASSSSRRSRISRRRSGTRSSPSTCRPPSMPSAPRPGHEGEEMGPHHQHRVGPRAGRLAVQVGLCGGQARHRRPDQNRRARARDLRRHRQCICPAMSGRRWSSTRSRTR